jgi:4-amino-4-deoxy-L-arabinose transferase-like glycosyltransferase
MLKTAKSRETWLFWILALLVLGAGLGLRDPWPADEPRFTLVAKHMIESGDWLFPHRGTELYSDKPPFFMWLQATAYTLFGNWRVAFLLPSLLAALGTLWCVTDLGKRLWTRRVGLYAGYALLFTLHFTYQAKKAQIDPTVVFWITLANYGLLRHLLRGGDWRMWMLGWFAAGMGTITKGVGALALIMLVPAAFAAMHGWNGVVFPLRRWRVLLGPLAFLVAISLWLVPMVTSALHHPDPAYRAYLDDILFRQTAGRYTRSWDHHQPAWYHLGVMLSMWLPLVFALPWALPAWKRRLQRRDPRYLLPLVWWALIVLFFSIPHGKRDVYILPALPMACLAFAPLLPGILRKAWPRRIALLFATAFAVAMTGAGLAMLFGHPGFEDKLIGDRGLSSDSAPFAWSLLAMGIGAWASLLWFGRRRPIAAMLSTLTVIWVLYGLLVYPLLNDSSSARGLMTAVDRRLPAQAQLGLVAWKEQNLLMAQRKVTTFGFRMPWGEQLRHGIEWQSQAPAQRWLLVQEPALSTCVDRSKAEFAGRSNRRAWWLVPAAAVIPGCVPGGKELETGTDESG